MPKIHFNKTLLDKVCTRDNCQVELTEQQYKDLTRNKKITYICGIAECNEKGVKKFSMMYKNGGFCNACQKKISKERRKKTNNIRLGNDYPGQNAEVKQKMKNTNLIRYGKDNASKNLEIIQKIKDTNQIRYGGNSPAQNAEVYQKVKDTNNAKYGHECSLQNAEVKQKSINTMQERYNVDHALQIAEVSAKALNNSFKSKPFTYPCGNVIQVQGFEPFALEVLVEQEKKFEDITTDRTQVPEIWYKTEDDKKHRYFCDILLHNEDKIIEVKSDWTYKQGEETIIPLKAQACIDAGFEFEIWIFDKKKNLQVITYDKPAVTFTEMLLAM